MASDELEAMQSIEKALEKMADDEARKRALVWACSRYGLPMDKAPNPPDDSNASSSASGARKTVARASGDTEISGIAVLDSDGNLTFTLQDVKAKSALDASIRLTLVAAYVHEKLTGNPEMSRKKVLVPLLTDWRIYDGNTRQAIVRHRGIIRKGRSALKLDSTAKRGANVY